MKYHRYMNFVPKSEIEYALSEYERQGDKRARRVFTLTNLSGEVIVGKKSFFDAVMHSFPLDPPIIPANSRYIWDAFQDSIRGGLLKLDEELIDIVWDDIDSVAKLSVPTVIEGVRFFLDAIDKFREYYWGKKNVKARLLLVYRENQPGFSEGFWFP